MIFILKVFHVSSAMIFITETRNYHHPDSQIPVIPAQDLAPSRSRSGPEADALLPWSSPHGRQMPHDHIQGLDRLKGDAGKPPRKCIV